MKKVTCMYCGNIIIVQDDAIYIDINILDTKMEDKPVNDNIKFFKKRINIGFYENMQYKYYRFIIPVCPNCYDKVILEKELQEKVKLKK
jgi:hypothetical protein